MDCSIEFIRCAAREWEIAPKYYHAEERRIALKGPALPLALLYGALIRHVRHLIDGGDNITLL